MKFTMTVNMDNAAFDEPAELSRILRKVIDQVEEGRLDMVPVQDINGNTVGNWEIA